MTRDPILERFAHRLRHRPDDVVVASPSRAATVAELDGLAEAVERLVRDAALDPSAPVALAAPNGPSFLAAWLGLRRAGHPVLLLDDRTPATEQRSVAAHLGAAAVVVCPERWPRRGSGHHLERLDAPPPPLPPGAASIRLTSGSTGMPRGIVHTSDALLADDRQLTATMGLGDRERILAAVPLSHAYGFASIALPALVRSSVAVVPDHDGPFAPLEAASACDVTFLPTVPAYLQAVLRMEQPPPVPEATRLVISAGAPLQPATAARFREVYGRPVHVFYGASEVGGICFDREGGAAERGTLGTPVDGVRVELRGGGGHDAGTGLVVVRTAAAASATLPDADPRLRPGELTTSDVGRLDARGELVLVGRADDVVNIRGKKVHPREVGRVVAELEGVDEVVVVGFEGGDGGQALRAVVASPPGGVDEATVRRWCLARLAAHKVPRSIVVVGSVPRTSRGKVDRRALLELAGR